MKFKIGEKVVCVNVKQSSYYTVQRPDLTTIKLRKTYTIVNTIPYSNNITIINDNGNKQAYSKRRFRPINEFRTPKIKKIINNIKKD